MFPMLSVMRDLISGLVIESARLVYLYSIAAARKNIRISHSYFVPDNLLVEALLGARKRGVKIEIITPGVIDANVVRRASRARWNELLKAGVEFYEYQPTMIHTKSMVVDGLVALFGSSNFDARSSEINEELDFVVYDEKFGHEAEGIFEKDLRESREYTLEDFKKRSLWERTSEWLMLPFRSQL